MRTRVLTQGTIAAAAAVAVGMSGRADGKADEAAVRKVVGKLEMAFKNKDLKGVMALSTPDFTEKAMGQTMTAAQAKAEFESYSKSTTAVRKMELKPMRIEVKGDTAVVTISQVSDLTQVQPGPKGKSHRVEGKGIGRVTLVKRKGQWKVRLYEHISVTMKMDGKPVKTP